VRGQIFLEFLIAFLVMILIVQFLIQSQEGGLTRLSREMNQTRTKMELEKIASACNLVYFNWKKAEFGFSFNLSSFKIVNRTIISEELGRNVSSKCLSEISGINKIEITGVKRWF
jgi:hypothetical protein